MRRAWPLAGTALAASLVCSACTVDNSNGNDSSDSDAQKLTVSATDDACKVSPDHAPAGTLTFAVTNNGTKMNEFYLLSEDGKKVVGEVEDIGPGLSRNLVVHAEAGKYVTACKPGMTGKGLRADFTVTGD
jgi:iron uptake system component EfeO